MELVKVDHIEYGVEESKAKEIQALFAPMLTKMVDLEEEYNELAKMEVNKDTCKAAKVLRMKYVKTRTGTAAIHKELKAESLRIGKMLDGWKNTQLLASKEVEAKIEDIEKHFERLEEERIEKLQAERSLRLGQYSSTVLPDNLGKMDNEVWSTYLLGAKATFEAKIEANRLAEIQKENNRIESERIAEELRKDAAKKEKERKALESENKRLKSIAQKKEQERIKEENKRIASDKKKEAARKEEIRVEAETLRKAAAAPDKEKVLNFAKLIKSLDMPVLNTEHGAFIMDNVSKLIEKVETYIIEASEKF